MADKTAKANVSPVRQRTQYSCMAASMTMCLRALDHDVTEDEVNRVMGARPMKGAAWEQALATAQHYGCRATLTMPSTVEQLRAWSDRGIPIMIAWNPEGRPWSHASTAYDVTDELPNPVPDNCTIIGSSGPWVWVADPNIPNPKKTTRIVSEDEFYGKWYEKFPDYLVRRPACAIEREITSGGQNVRLASKKAVWGYPSHLHTPPPFKLPPQWKEIPSHSFGRKWEWYSREGDLYFRIVEFDDGDPGDIISRGFLYGLQVRDPDGGTWVYKTRSKHFGVMASMAEDTVKWWKKARPDSMANVFPTKGMFRPLSKMATREREMTRTGKGRSQTAPKTQDERRQEQGKTRGDAPKPRNEAARALAERGGGGAGKHHTRERDVAKGRSRKDKHKTKWAAQIRDTSGRVWGPKQGLEGPFKYRGGEVLYYDPRHKGGTYYDPTTDMYLSHDEAARIVMRQAAGHWAVQRLASRFIQAIRADYEAWVTLIPGSDVKGSKEQKLLQAFWKYHQSEGNEAVHLDNAMEMAAWDLGYQGRDLRRFAPALLGLAKIRGNTQDIQLSYKEGLVQGRSGRSAGYKGNPDGKDIYPREVDHGEHEALSGGFDVMKRLQERYRVEQGHEGPYDNSPQLTNQSARDKAAARKPEIHLHGRRVQVNAAFLDKIQKMYPTSFIKGVPRGGVTLIHPAADEDPRFDGGSDYDFQFSPSRQTDGMYDVVYTPGYLILLQKDGDKMNAQTTRLARSLSNNP